MLPVSMEATHEAERILLDVAGMQFVLTVTEGDGVDPLVGKKVGDGCSRSECRGDDERRCRSEHVKDHTGYQCSRGMDHPGQHLALAGARVAATWPRPGGVDPLAHLVVGSLLDREREINPERGNRCESKGPTYGYYCSRGVDHPGQHIATGGRDVIEVWPGPLGTGTEPTDPLAHVKKGDHPDPTNDVRGRTCALPVGRWVCTREDGHPGQCIAGDSDSVLEVCPKGGKPKVEGTDPLAGIENGDDDPTEGPDEQDPCEWDIRGDSCTRPTGHPGQHISGDGERVLDCCPK